MDDLSLTLFRRMAGGTLERQSHALASVALTFFLAGISRFLLVKGAVGLSLGRADVLAIAARFLRQLEGDHPEDVNGQVLAPRTDPHRVADTTRLSLWLFGPTHDHMLAVECAKTQAHGLPLPTKATKVDRQGGSADGPQEEQASGGRGGGVDRGRGLQ
jgi:hypothetical protein